MFWGNIQCFASNSHTLGFKILMMMIPPPTHPCGWFCIGWKQPPTAVSRSPIRFQALLWGGGQHPVTKICIGGILKMHFNIQLSILRSIKDRDRIKVMFQTSPTKNGFDISSNLHVGLIIIAFWVFQMWNCFPKCHLNILSHLQSSYNFGFQASDSVGRLWLFSLIIPYLK